MPLPLERTFGTVPMDSSATKLPQPSSQAKGVRMSLYGPIVEDLVVAGGGLLDEAEQP
jgi:hypothetical protein